MNGLVTQLENQNEANSESDKSKNFLHNKLLVNMFLRIQVIYSLINIIDNNICQHHLSVGRRSDLDLRNLLVENYIVVL